MDLAAIGIDRIEVFLLVLARTAGIFSVVPIFGAGRVPPLVRVAASVGLAIVFVPLCLPGVIEPLARDVLTMSLLVAREAMVGLAIGFVTALVFAAIQAAGEFIDLHAGFSFAAMIDPINGAQTAVAGRLHHLLAGLIFFVCNCHHIMISGLADSFRTAPLGGLALDPSVTEGMVEIFSSLFVVAIKVAAPVVVAVFLADVALVLVSRAVPQMNVLMVGFPLKLGVGLVGMLVALPVAVALSRDAFGYIDPGTSGIIRLLAGR